MEEEKEQPLNFGKTKLQTLATKPSFIPHFKPLLAYLFCH
ncbi:hypothetical protein HMPREF1869_01531 [Bacteroidales bacterium KA00251]|nr:hypothetical protein HMPREF1869_01531 [Bacteroidales bacterium KA00251]